MDIFRWFEGKISRITEIRRSSLMNISIPVSRAVEQRTSLNRDLIQIINKVISSLMLFTVKNRSIH